MAAKISLKDLEHKLFRESIRDGILDIQIGMILLNFAVIPLLSDYLGDFWSSATFLIVWPVITFGSRAFRRAYIQPRVGQIEFGEYRKKKLSRLNKIYLGFNLAVLILGGVFFFRFSGIPESTPTALLSLFLLIGFSLAGLMLEYPRLYGYGILVALSPPIGEFLYQTNNASHHGFPVMFGISGGLLILIGLLDLRRVFKKYPMTQPEDLV